MIPEDIFENFDESHHCNNLEFEQNGESMTCLGELQVIIPIYYNTCCYILYKDTNC